MALFSGALCATKCWTYDTWWHLATGRWIAEQGSIPTENMFSHTFPAHQLHTVEWLGDLVYYSAYAALGLSGLVVLKVVFAASVSATVGLRARRMGTGPIVVLACLFFAAILLQPRLSADRPLVVSYFLTALQLWLLEGFRDVGAGPEPKRGSYPALVVLVLLPWVWVPIHGYAILCLGFAGAFTVEALVNRYRRPSTTVRFNLVALAIMSLSACCALFLTPWGRGILQHAWGLQAAGAQAILNEWRPAEWADLTGRDSARIWLLLLGLVVSLRRRQTLLPAGGGG